MEEARCVLDHQIAKVKDIDDKALRTVRIAVLFLGLVFSVTQLEGTSSFVNECTILGGSLLVISIGFGVLTYTVSEPDLGPGPSYVDDLLDSDPDPDEWEATLLAGYGDWMEDTHKVNEENAFWLLCTQACLVVGVLLIGIGVVLAL
jgi:hypothetical protein